ncbi:hypothetical protein QA942_19830 [Streptomyces sp. B21-106]|uniref:hypothetical protein n=1 Tax=Streptomyces sp. B21-106 TaxID=3039418 RepID=UPI002FEEDC0C
MTVRPCWTCKQPATHTLTRAGSIPLDACDNCTRIDRAEAESRGWTVGPIGGAPVLDAVKKCGPKTIPLYECGGLAYLSCLKAAGHDGRHTP